MSGRADRRVIFLNEHTRHRVSVPQMLPHLQPCYQHYQQSATVANSSLDLLRPKGFYTGAKILNRVLNLRLEAGENVFIPSFSVSANYSSIDDKE